MLLRFINRPRYHHHLFLTPFYSLHSSSASAQTKHHALDSYSALSSFLQSCVAAKALEPGKQLHARLLLSGLGYDAILATKLVNLYCVCDHLPFAYNLFDRIPHRNVFPWNVLIRAFACHGPQEVAISLYYRMLDAGLQPDNFTFPFVLKACSSLSAIEAGREIHEHVVHFRWESDIFVGAALVDMYAKCGCVDDAREVFDEIPKRDIVMWNSMICAYSQNGRPFEALSLCRDMAIEGFLPTEATLVIIISTAADVAALPRGREIHGYSWRRGFESCDKVNTALVDMYAKSGRLKVARILFDKLMDKRLVSWNAMISGYAMHGHANEALDLFDEMQKEAQVMPDHITFVGVLSACSHGGLMEEGWRFFNSMWRDHSIRPMPQHYTCMIDLLGHSGRLDEAYRLIQEMSMAPDSGVWGALLSACKMHKNVELGEEALERLIDLEPNNAGNYVLLSNIYAQAGKWEGTARVRKLMTYRGLKKSVACSWIEVKNKVHAFLVGDVSHTRTEEIYRELERLEGRMKRDGYIPDTTPVFHDVEDDEKRNMVRSHSERLAIAFGIISTPPGTRLLVTKNLRVCEDCHVAIKFISKIVGREITIRDVNRYHHFENGKCSCGDYW